eukprot:COSAG01_NODE_1253_length_11047_cov_243.281695_2_plen_142_part_00
MQQQQQQQQLGELLRQAVSVHDPSGLQRLQLALDALEAPAAAGAAAGATAPGTSDDGGSAGAPPRFRDETSAYHKTPRAAAGAGRTRATLHDRLRTSAAAGAATAAQQLPPAPAPQPHLAGGEAANGARATRAFLSRYIPS